MTFKKLISLITILIIQIVAVNSQTYSVNPITPSGNPTPTNPPISLVTHIIKVGYMGNGFSRNNFTAGAGNVLTWIWEGKGEHSVAESTLENPCIKKEGDLGFDLGQHSEPYNISIAVEERTYVFFSYVSDDCQKGMYGGINLPPDYTWPKDLEVPPKQIETTPLNPTTTPTPTGSMTIQAENAENTQETTKKSSSASSYDFKGSSYGIISIIIGTLMLINLYLIL